MVIVQTEVGLTCFFPLLSATANVTIHCFAAEISPQELNSPSLIERSTTHATTLTPSDATTSIQTPFALATALRCYLTACWDSGMSLSFLGPRCVAGRNRSYRVLEERGGRD